MHHSFFVIPLIVLSGFVGLSSEEPSLIINNESRELPEQSTVTFANRRSIATVSQDGIFRGTLSDGGSGSIQLEVSAQHWTFNGSMKAASGTSKTRLSLNPSSHVEIGKDASINQQMNGMIMARPLYVHGQEGSIFELNEHFKADQMGFGNIDTWHPSGFSVLFIDGPELRTHHSQSLPVVHKRSGNGNHTFHGVISFGAKNSKNLNRWIVDTNPQGFIGLFLWNGPLEINTKTHLKMLGHYSEDSHCYFGGTGPLTKTGPSTLAIVGTQYHAPGSLITVQEGRLLFLTSPSNPGKILAADLPAGTTWNELQLVNSAQGTIQFSTPAAYRSQLKSLQNDGTVLIDGAGISIDQTFISGENSRLEIDASSLSRKQALITCSGSISLNGTLALTLANGRLKAGDYPLFQAATLSGTPSLELPAGYSGELIAGTLRISKHDR